MPSKQGPVPGPRFRHTDDENWHEVRAIQVGERRASVEVERTSRPAS
jgi:hypothetical protein